MIGSVKGDVISDAAYGGGDASERQFTREYGGMFGKPPARDIRQARALTDAAA